LSPLRRVVFRPQAEDEALEARAWYDARRDGLGREFSAEVEAVVERIRANPFAFPRAYKEKRRAVLQRFPYAIYFRVTGDDVVVLAVHGRQHPARWRGRV
jgi:plasmid stabilization system protein ParE